MKFTTMPARKVGKDVKLHEFKQGDYSFRDMKIYEGTELVECRCLLYFPPDLDFVYNAPLTTDKAKQNRRGDSGTYWWWNGDEDKPTLKPSIGVPANPPYKWHGFLTDGVWAACE